MNQDEEALTGEALRERIAAELLSARDRTTLLTTAVDEGDLIRQHSPLMSPLVWDLAHIANQEELWLLREVGGRTPIHPEIDPLYDAFEHPRAERPTLPLLTPLEARRYGHEDATGGENGVDHRVGLEVLSPSIYMHRLTIA